MANKIWKKTKATATRLYTALLGDAVQDVDFEDFGGCNKRGELG